MVFNGQYPGPAIVADWGDTIEVTVVNSTPDNGTSIHWHGLRQLHSNQMDGTNGITECPIAPGQTKVYTFKATEYGTSWYHSHYSVQYGDGLVGTILINGPASANYDIDLGVFPLTDWYHEPMFELLASRPAAPPTSQSLLVSGAGGNAPLTKIKFTPGKTHRLRFVNTGINQFLHIGIDSHKMTVIAADFVPVKPFDANTLVLGVGQRYDVLVEASQATANYYLRIGTGGGQCDGPNEQAAANNTKGAIVTYDGAGDAAPADATTVTFAPGCGEETNLVPFWADTVPAPPAAPVGLHLTLDTTVGVAWKVNGNAMDIDWLTPTLSYVMNGTYVLPASDAGIVIGSSSWQYFLITNDSPLPHPIHLHGHDFYIVATGTGDGSDAVFNGNNPIRRDTHTVQGNNGVPGAGGYAMIAFPADNPGAWLLHCHIPFHISGGLGVQFLERPSEIIGSLGDLSGYTEGCSSWSSYEGPAASAKIVQPDSGLRKRSRAVRH